MMILVVILLVCASVGDSLESDERSRESSFNVNPQPYPRDSQKHGTYEFDTVEGREDRVESLPGATELDFLLYAGSVDLADSEREDDASSQNSLSQRRLFYALAESASKTKDSDPLVLWLNGGPGCSSLAGGFLSELGPFYPSPGGKSLIKNQYRWNSEANVLFLDSPAFVGWSWSDDPDDVKVGDKRVAEDSYVFLQRWLERFPRYKNRKFWIAGESYGGHYVPNLALQFVRNIQKKDNIVDLDFQGFLVGNAWTDPVVDNVGAVKFWYSHGMISRNSRDGILDACDPGEVGPLLSRFDWNSRILSKFNDEDPDFVRELREDISGIHISRKLQSENVDLITDSNHFAGESNHRDHDQECDMYINQAMEEGFVGGLINIYDIYADVCLRDAAVQGAHLGPSTLLQKKMHQSPPRYDPCIDDEVTLYMNRQDVQKALHANTTGEIPGPWQTCSNMIQYNRSDILSSMIPVYKELLSQTAMKPLQILVYSGDVDAIVPIIGTREWISRLNLTEKEPWHPWRSRDKQIGGWTVTYDNGFSFASVRGAGHMVPYTQPERAQTLFLRFVHGQPI